jgi:aspartokinase-like uncharacterized kinase
MSSEFWVVKAGGSLHDAPELKHWLHTLALTGGGRMAIVPGGGPFADQVRAAQKREGFKDTAAHRMAVLAMERYGRMLVDMQPGLRPASTDRELRDVLNDREVPVWMPTAMLDGAADIHCDWETSSDSLAAWLAARLGAAHLALIKSAPPRPGPWPASHLAAEGIVDRRLQDHLQQGHFHAWWLGRDDYRHFADYINAEQQPHAEII